MQGDLFGEDVHKICVAPGAFHLRGFLEVGQQQTLVALIDELGGQPAGFYTPRVRGGSPMRLKMLCLGRHWNATTYGYEERRTDADGLPVPPIPPLLTQIAQRAAREADMVLNPDIVIINHYADDGRLGIHQDKEERAETLARGVPVVSISLGDDAEFLFGGSMKGDPTQLLVLRSGDAFVFGGPSRLARHGVKKIRAGTAPEGLSLSGRLNLTFREY